MTTLISGANQLTVDGNGHLVEVAGNGTAWHSQAGPFWRMTVQAPSTPSVLGVHRQAVPAAAPAIESAETEIVLRYTGMRVEGEPVEIDLEARIAAVDEGFAFTFSVTNRSDAWTVRELRAPLISAAVPADAPPALLWPMGAGERFEDPARSGVMSVPYPVRLFMPWMALDAGRHGLYVASHDESLRTVTLNTDACRIAGAIVLSIGLYPFCDPGEETVTAPVMVRPYAGTWHAAASYYRSWADTWFRQIERPSWVREASGWQLVILKQQNGEIHWPYTDLGTLVELGRENGLNVLGLFGWTEGGHDRRYPIYEPEPEMGGEEALREGIRKAHAAGQKVILYTNGQLRDILTDWHDRYGRETAALSERGDMFGESWQKYSDAPPRRMTYGCQSSTGWADTLLEFAKKVEGLGADGIIFDQLGSCQPMFCFSTSHNHQIPADATGPGVAANMARIQHEMHAINPEFIVIVEHVADGVNQHVDFTHGCGVGFNPDGRSFPELLRFTFPEIWTTQRHATPTMDRNTANWACMMGFAHEVEYRYRPDRLYIEKGILPQVADYERIPAPPSIGLMRALEPRAAADYLRQVIEFEQRHIDVFRDGVFRDSLGFSLDNSNVRAKAFESEDTVGIIIWNPTDAAQGVSVTVEGAEFADADAPEGACGDPGSPIPAQSVRLMRYTRSRA